MISRRLLLCAVGLPLLSGCQSMMALGAFGGMAASAAMQSRPDRKLEYQIEVQTFENKTLMFKGVTECPHSVNINSYRGHYSTKTPYSSLIQDGEHWVLTGINCDNEIVEEVPSRYVLYRTINEIQGKAYFVIRGGSAQLTKSTFDSWIASSSNEPASHFDKYSDGPYVYQKFARVDVPSSVKGQIEPLVVYEATNLCGKQNPKGLALSKSDFLSSFGGGLLL